MNYELAKKLKDMGFPQEGIWGTKYYKPNGGFFTCTAPTCSGEIVMFGDAKIPTLSELIEACGERGVFSLVRRSNTALKSWEWIATTPHLEIRSLVEGFGLTPEEAVSELWLSLNKK